MTKEAKRARRVYLRLFILLKGNATLTPLSARACPSTGSSLKQLRAMYGTLDIVSWKVGLVRLAITIATFVAF